MKNNNLYNRIYEHSFSLLLTFSFYAIIIALMLSCEDEEEVATIQWGDGKQITTPDGATYTVGHLQISERNQDPIVEKKDNQGSILWKVTHASSPANETAELITLDHDGNLWVVFILDGEETSTNSIKNKFAAPDAFHSDTFSSFHKSQHKNVAAVAQLDPENGKIIKGSFLTLPSNNHAAQQLSIRKIGITHYGDILLETGTTAWLCFADEFMKIPAIAKLSIGNDFLQLRSPVCANLSELQRK